MRVVHINEADSKGGAGIAAFRLHLGLLENGLKSSLLVRRKHSKENSVLEFEDPCTGRLPEDLVSSIYSHYVENNRTDISNTHYSLSLQSLEVWEHSEVKKADVIHLHWISSLLNPRDIGRILKMGKPVFWTLHDINPFTGGCHFSAGCHEFENACETCPQLKADPFHLPAAVLQDKEALWDLSRLTLICPSHWIEEQARNSKLFRNHPNITTLQNCIDPTVFRKSSQADARRRLELEALGPVIMVAAEDGNEKRKGFKEVFKALRQCCEDDAFLASRPSILKVGRAHEWLDELPIPTVDLGWVDSEEELALIFAASDFFVIPSHEDNLPNMAIEAASCGLPVCGFDIGGLPDIVENGKTGFLVALDEIEALADKILLLTLNEGRRSELSDAATENAHRKFGASSVVPLIVELYDDAIKRMESPPNSKEEIQPDESSPGPSVSVLLPAISKYCEDKAISLLSKELKQYQQICDDRQKVIDEQSAEIEMLRHECDSRLEIINQYKSESRRILKWLKR